jgi:hypothetical protein
MIPAAAQGKLSYCRLSISFPDGSCLTATIGMGYLQAQDQLF